MESLYKLTSDYEALMEYADSTNPDDQQVFEETLDSVTATLDVKMDDYAVVMDHMEAQEDLLDKEIKRLTARKKAIENNRKRMMNRLYDSMVATNRKTVATDHRTFRIKKNGGKLPLIIDGDVPDKYYKMIYEVDKDKIRLALETGNNLEFAHFGERGEHVEIN